MGLGNLIEQVAKPSSAICCAFQLVNGCFACHSMAEITFFSIFLSFSLTNRKKENRRKKEKIYNKQKRESKSVDVTFKHWLTPKFWPTPLEKSFFFVKYCKNSTGVQRNQKVPWDSAWETQIFLSFLIRPDYPLPRGVMV